MLGTFHLILTGILSGRYFYPPAEAEMGKLRLREMKSRAYDGTQGLR